MTMIQELYNTAIRAGAAESADDCIGGDLRAPEGASAECVKAVRQYRLAARAHHSYVHGPELREIYFGR